MDLADFIVDEGIEVRGRARGSGSGRLTFGRYLDSAAGGGRGFTRSMGDTGGKCNGHL